MFAFGFIIGIYSYIIFILGITSLLYKQNILIVTGILAIVLFFLFRKKLTLPSLNPQLPFLHYFLIGLFLVQAAVNLIGALGPELGFDALWYHLTLPKLYLQSHTITYIHGGLFYYSTMPQLTEMLYIVLLTLSNEITAKIVHYLFGILSSIALYFMTRKFTNKFVAVLSVVIFYANLVVAWQSITAYIDLSRTFFEIMALWGFINWLEKREKIWLIESAVMIGLAISTKLLALGSVFIFTLLIILDFVRNTKIRKAVVITNILVYWWLSLIIALPWFVFSFVNTANPVSPFFTSTYPVVLNLNPMVILSDIFDLFIKAADPISPLYLIFLPLIVYYFKRFPKVLQVVAIYSGLSLLLWYLTPRTGGGRFILPYLPSFSLLVGYSIYLTRSHILLWRFGMILVILTSLISISYRAVANSKYIPVLIGKESKQQFLINNLNFNFGDFYDTDKFFEKTIKKTDRVLLYGFHNLYYVNFPLIDSSFAKKGDEFNYIAVQNVEIPLRFADWTLIHENKKTQVKVYSDGGRLWFY